MVDTDFLVNNGSGPNLAQNRDCFNQLMSRTEKRLRQLIRSTLGEYQLVRQMDGSGVVLVGLQLRLYKRLQNFSIQTREDFFSLAVRELHRELLTLVRTYRDHLGDPRVPMQFPVDEYGNELTLEFSEMGRSPEDLTRWELFYNSIYALEGDLGEIFRLRYLGDCSFEEIGKRYQPNIKPDAARKWASRAFNKACVRLLKQLGGSIPAHFAEEMNKQEDQ